MTKRRAISAVLWLAISAVLWLAHSPFPSVGVAPQEVNVVLKFMMRISIGRISTGANPYTSLTILSTILFFLLICSLV